MTHSVNNNISRFPQPHLSLPNELMNKVSLVTGMEVMLHGLSNTDFPLTKANLTMATSYCTIF